MEGGSRIGSITCWLDMLLLAVGSLERKQSKIFLFGKSGRSEQTMQGIRISQNVATMRIQIKASRERRERLSRLQVSEWIQKMAGGRNGRSGELSLRGAIVTVPPYMGKAGFLASYMVCFNEMTAKTS